nr:RNA-directed DNA polymerase, eukaryota [Tanacetum cinerariifolium]
LISETFKIIVKGRVFMVRAKELFTWNPSIIDNKEKDYASEEESDFVPNNNDPNNHINEEIFGDVYGSDDDGVPETVFGSNTSSPNQVDGGKENSKSEDPFGIYDSESRPSLSHPPGFTLEGVVHHEMLGTVNKEADNNGGKDNLVPVSARVMNTSQDIP